MYPEHLHLLYIDKHAGIRDRLLINHPWLVDAFNQILPNHSFKNFKDIRKENYVSGSTALSQQSFLHVITETVFDYPNVYVSEKSIKPISSKRPFVIAGSTGCLANLKSIGFKTFDRYWSEHYDAVDDPVDRLLAVVSIVESICNKSVAELKEMCMDMQDILDYNFNYYYNELHQLELKNFAAECQKNLGVR